MADTRDGSLNLQRDDGKSFSVFAPGSTAQAVSWSPDSRRLLVVETHWLPPQPGAGVVATEPIQIWQVRVEAHQPDHPTLLFEAKSDQRQPNANLPEQIDFGGWAPNSRYVLFWLGPLSGSIQADGTPLLVLDVETGKATQIADSALLNSLYQSWAPDGSALAFTDGGDRSAQVNKWLDIFDVATGQVTTVISKTEAIPGNLAWSPRGDWIAYAAVTASDSASGEADYMGFDNSAILKRHMYLLDPKTHAHHRLNQVDAFQDAPAWNHDGSTLYYVQRDGDDMVLMAANPATGEAQAIEGSRRPAPHAVGYYGQSNWDDLLAYRPDTPQAPVPKLDQTYLDAGRNFSLRYPAGWYVSRDWSTPGYQCFACVTLSPSPETDGNDFTPFGGEVFVSIESMFNRQSDTESLLQELTATPGPGQILDRGARLTVFDRRTETIDGKPAIRMETMGEFGVVDHVLVVEDGERVLVLRGRGDGRLFDAIAQTLRLTASSTPISTPMPPVTEWPIYRQNQLGVQVRYPTGWQVDNSNGSPYFCETPQERQCIEIAYDWTNLKQPSDFHPVWVAHFVEDAHPGRPRRFLWIAIPFARRTAQPFSVSGGDIHRGVRDEFCLDRAHMESIKGTIELVDELQHEARTRT
ncbi:MAG: hypothetical protein M1482_09750 [Chloroflexi bacterium]|nr:hypothetical protein [Chloroflexota bacterium]